MPTTHKRKPGSPSRAQFVKRERRASSSSIGIDSQDEAVQESGLQSNGDIDTLLDLFGSITITLPHDQSSASQKIVALLTEDLNDNSAIQTIQLTSKGRTLLYLSMLNELMLNELAAKVNITQLISDEDVVQWTLISFGSRELPPQMKNKLVRSYTDIEKFVMDQVVQEQKTLTNMVRHSENGLFPSLAKELKSKLVACNFVA